MLQNPLPAGRAGFSLVEVVLAMGVFAFVGVSLIGLFSVGLQTSRESGRELEATHVAESLFGMRRAAPTTDLAGRGFPLPVLTATNSAPAASPLYLTGDGALTNLAAARFGFLYSVVPDAAARSSRVYVCLYWPPQAATTRAQGRYEASSVLPLP